LRCVQSQELGLTDFQMRNVDDPITANLRRLFVHMYRNYGSGWVEQFYTPHSS